MAADLTPAIGDIMLFICPVCETIYQVEHKAEPSDRAPRCDECGEQFPNHEGNEWLHYQRDTGGTQP